SISSAVAMQTAKSGNMSSKTSEAYQRLASGQAEAAQQAAESVAAILRDSWPNLKVKALAAEGQPAEVLVQQAEKLNADTIVVGNKKAQGLQRILGSISRNVAATTNCDLYVVNTKRQSHLITATRSASWGSANSYGLTPISMPISNLFRLVDVRQSCIETRFGGRCCSSSNDTLGSPCKWFRGRQWSHRCRYDRYPNR